MSLLNSSSFNVLYTKDLDKTKLFYTAIGAEIKQSEVDKVVVGLGDFDLHIILAHTKHFEEYKYIAHSNSDTNTYGAEIIFYIETDNIEETYNLVKKARGRIKSEIKENHWGCREFLFEDPEGYKFAVYQ